MSSRLLSNLSSRLTLGKQRAGAVRSRQNFFGMLFVLPTVLFFLFFWIYPLLNSFYTSFTSWNLLTPRNFVGLENYAMLLKSKEFRNSIGVTLYYVAASCIPTWLISLGLALLFDRRFRLRDLYRGLFFVPVVMSWVVCAIIWKQIYTPAMGLYRIFTDPLGLPTLNWLGNAKLAMAALVIVAVWKAVGYYMVIFLAGLQGVPEEYYEAARMDGAGSLGTFFYITLPLIKPTTLFVIVISIINAFQVFTPAYVMTMGGPANALKVVPIFIYETAFLFLKMGYASSIAMILFMTLMILTLIQLKLFRAEQIYA